VPYALRERRRPPGDRELGQLFYDGQGFYDGHVGSGL
jgi:hypothetical protein